MLLWSYSRTPNLLIGKAVKDVVQRIKNSSRPAGCYSGPEWGMHVIWECSHRMRNFVTHASHTAHTDSKTARSVITSDNRATSMMMYDFRTLPDVNNWVESSDTVREPGMSKGAFVLQKTQLFQRAVMFSMINPQPNGAGFVGFNSQDTWDLSSYNGIELKVRGQGDNYVYKVNLRHNGEGTGGIAYEIFYEVSNSYVFTYTKFSTVETQYSNLISSKWLFRCLKSSTIDIYKSGLSFSS
ncbi:hypothetical protein E2C01_039095 [Portunus trituberculatus]|uniref:NADH:ubiquinone oxidoreductase intermediate-associated protein 30 domain-containing protein n=1 Tax=Portunus trituberculatus TaxID=210409 RepID=A0A5B7FIP3_PORTR|nr:hypothetical protein [Portunus trituberculatus]